MRRKPACFLRCFQWSFGHHLSYSNTPRVIDRTVSLAIRRELDQLNMRSVAKTHNYQRDISSLIGNLSWSRQHGRQVSQYLLSFWVQCWWDWVDSSRHNFGHDLHVAAYSWDSICNFRFFSNPGPFSRFYSWREWRTIRPMHPEQRMKPSLAGMMLCFSLSIWGRSS